MTSDADVLERMRQNQIGWRYAELARLLRRAGFLLVGGKGSHRRWKHVCGAAVTIVDSAGESKAAYVREVVEAVTRAREARSEDS